MFYAMAQYAPKPGTYCDAQMRQYFACTTRRTELLGRHGVRRNVRCHNLSPIWSAMPVPSYLDRLGRLAHQASGSVTLSKTRAVGTGAKSCQGVHPRADRRPCA